MRQFRLIDCFASRMEFGACKAICLIPQLFFFFLLSFTLPSVFFFASAVNAAEPAKDEPDADPDIEFASRIERAFQKLAKRVGPSVVSLSIEARTGNWIEEMRRMNEQLGTPERQFQGSGVIIDTAGYVITNEHVVRNAGRVRVEFSDGRICVGEVCGTDPRSDLAMVRLIGDDVPKNLSAANLADSDAVEVGQWALAVGNPFGLSNTLTVGVVSARGRSMPSHNFSNDVFYGNLIQTDAAINPGNSGGPLFDMRGKLIGINTMIFSRSGVSQGFGFAIPSNHLKKRLAYLKMGREIEYGWLGVSLQDLAPGQREFSVPENKGVVIRAVIPDTPADRAGLEQGMVIVGLEGTRIGNSQELIAAVNETPVGRTIKLKVLNRSAKPAEVSVRISKRNYDVVKRSQSNPRATDDDDGPDLEDQVRDQASKAAGEAAAAAKKLAFNWRGMQLKELLPAEIKKRGGGIEVLRVRKGTPADRAGFYEGAILTELKHAGNSNMQKFTTLEEFKKIITELNTSAAVYTVLDGYLTIEAEQP